MLHEISKERAGPHADEMIHAVEACVHCGFCLPTCPTYVILGQEMNSPRGRIILMKSALEGRLTVEETKPYIDCCLGCLACETSCPSGVPYGELMDVLERLRIGGFNKVALVALEGVPADPTQPGAAP